MQSSKLISKGPLVTSHALNFSFNFNFPYTQTLRWKRKPIWLPTAKTKVFRVPAKPIIPEDERVEIQRLYNNYRTYLRSIRNYFVQTVKKNQKQFDKKVIKQVEIEDFFKCSKINERWNKEIAKQREMRLEAEKKIRYLKISEVLQQKKLNEEKLVSEIEKKVKAIKLLAPTFITRDNIDSELTKLLNTTVDYNKALDTKGNWVIEEPNKEVIKNSISAK